MARRATTSDVYNAVAEPQRRHVINLLAKGELSVSDITETLEFSQPQTSKHLKVLKEVDLVAVRKVGKQRLYSLNGENLKPIHDWIVGFSHLWTERLDRLESYLDELQRKEDANEYD
jgi:DNA-binding transcriptional ArsR family regulator